MSLSQQKNSPVGTPLKIAVVLNGCGARDGSEIQEAVLTLLGLEQAGAEPVCFAPDELQTRVVNHLTGQVVSEKRHMLQESARIARGKIRSLDSLLPEAYDGIVVPGGSGTSYNLCNFAIVGSDARELRIHSGLERVLKQFYTSQRPIGAICIAPILIAKALSGNGITLTFGSPDHPAAKVARDLGAKVVTCSSESFVSDALNRVVTTPAYMHDAKLSGIWPGIQGLCAEVVRLCRESQTSNS